MLNLPNLNPLRPKLIPVHVALNTGRIRAWAKEKEKPLEEALKRHIELLETCLDWQEKRDVPVLSIRITPNIPEEQNALAKWLIGLSSNPDFLSRGVRVFVIGDWYGLEPNLVDAVKSIMDATKDFDKRFLNILLQYDGQEEMVMAIELIVRKILAEKMKIDEVNKETIKESIYSSNFVPPELVIETSRKYSGMLLWDAKNALIFFTEKFWLDFDKGDLDEALDFYAKDKKETEKEEKEGTSE
ncbi:MAG: undecaprenyl diphosphate synthase family protein [Candidatus Woesearchaeota archaeon]